MAAGRKVQDEAYLWPCNVQAWGVWCAVQSQWRAGMAGREGVVVIAACNHPEQLDPAIRRAGRFDRLKEVAFVYAFGLKVTGLDHAG